jgi:cysteine synthase
VPLWQKDIADQIERVSTEEARAMVIRLAREAGRQTIPLVRDICV